MPLRIELAASASSSHQGELRHARTFALAALAATGIAAAGAYTDVVALAAVAGLAAAFAAIGAVGSLVLAREAQVIGPLAIALADARGAAKPGIEVAVTFERASPGSVIASIGVGRFQRSDSGSSARVQVESVHHATIDLERAPGDVARYVGRFELAPTDPLPPSGPHRDGGEVRWKLDLEVAIGGSTYRLPYALRATEP
jgi:hypothetical protein